uniref:Fe2OG dioxygenase domain-containing protein n=1 Tax=Globisporangium ultimum (strain ATCC 200006 / CBS 805.95 / DAOM BR144) TaxID=431595 RepID=K3WFC0_GLOUD
MAKTAKRSKTPSPTAADDDALRSKPTEKASSAGESWTLLGFVVLLGAAIVATAVHNPEEVRHATSRALGHIVTQFGLDNAFSVHLDAFSRSVDCSDALQYLTTVHPVKGFHVVCVEKSPMDSLFITGYKDGMHPKQTSETAIDLMAFTHEVEHMFQIKEPMDEYAVKFKQPYAFFTPDGVRLATKLGDLVNRVVFLFEGGQFIWPGITIGHKTIVKDVYKKGDVVLETLSMTPLVFGVDEFLKDDEINVILELSLDHLNPSGVALNDAHKDRPATDWRTSTTYFLPSSRHPLVQDIDRRTADLVKVPVSHQEYVQVLRYEETQKYDHHLDYFSVENHQKSPQVLENIEYGFKNRMITVFWYMSDVARGGHTIFPRAGGQPKPSTMRDCTKGLKVPPQKRKVIVFYSMLPNGEGDPMSLHGGCPVEEGIKYSGNKWVWNKPRINP